MLRIKAVLVIALLGLGTIKSETLTNLAESELFQEAIVFARSSQYQRIVVTRGRTGFSMFLNGNLQFNSFDEYRYHEALVHPAFASTEKKPERILILGGGDGLAAREVLKYDFVKEVILVDLDSEITDLAVKLPLLADLNQNALKDPRIKVINADAFVWLDQEKPAPFDLAVVDFPDPNNFALGKLYSTRFYKLLSRSLKNDAPVVIQSTSPLYARRSFWCINETLKASGFEVKPYKTSVPSFGIWGYVLAKKQGFETPTQLKNGVETKFLDSETLAAMFRLSVDTEKPDEEIEINRLDNQALVRYYESEWRRFE